MNSKTLGFIGGGRVTRIILQSFVNKQLDFSSIVVCDTNPETLKDLKQQFPKIQITDSCLLAADEDIVFIALHPPVIMQNLELIKESLSEKSVVISLAPKINISLLSGKLETRNIARMIPNATSYINQGFNPISFSAEFSTSEKQYLLNLLNSTGNTMEVEENKLEAYAIISAMLPTYFWFQWEEIYSLGQKMGLNESESRTAIRDTLKASIDLFYGSGLSSNEVMDLIPVKPIGEFESQIVEIYQTRLMGLYQKIKP
jgi:pyrroline-5-carboxylate reductase